MHPKKKPKPNCKTIIPQNAKSFKIIFGFEIKFSNKSNRSLLLIR